MWALVRAGLRYHRGVHAMVVLGVAVAVTVMAGALMVGSSVRASLAELALARLGATERIVTSPSFFRVELAIVARRVADHRGHWRARARRQWAHCRPRAGVRYR